MHVLTVVGARPQFIKAAPVSRALQAAGWRETLLHTGQHYDHDMSDLFFAELGLRDPQIHLGVGSGSHAEQTSAMLVGVERELIRHKPDGVLIYGDTNSTLAGALAAAKLHVPVSHVEAGLRSFNTRMPEEINRIVADRVSTLLFAPTEAARRNLEREGYPMHDVFQVGDVMLDAIRLFSAKAQSQSSIMERLGVQSDGYILATIHRAENTDDPKVLARILKGLQRVAQQVPVVLPLHPRTRKMLGSTPEPSSGRFLLTGPLGFLDMQRLEASAQVIATDSGGVQKEAFWHGIPCVTLRHETEWTELVDAGCNELCPPLVVERIAECILGARSRPIPDLPLHGDGKAAQHIVRHLTERLGNREG
jgi:UDP-GlcNAc3NAcA epimerase